MSEPVIYIDRSKIRDGKLRDLETRITDLTAFIELVQLLTIDVYGAVDPELVAQLRQKAELLGGASVAIHPFHVGFVRSPST
jgi:hypothetical protein